MSAASRKPVPRFQGDVLSRADSIARAVLSVDAGAAAASKTPDAVPSGPGDLRREDLP
jgi:hypothetical protein